MNPSGRAGVCVSIEAFNYENEKAGDIHSRGKMVIAQAEFPRILIEGMNLFSY